MASTSSTTTTTTKAADADASDDLRSQLNLQRLELMAAKSLESDLDFAFRLQLQEAISASLVHLPSTSTSSPVPVPIQEQESSFDAVSPTFVSLQSEELTKMDRELADSRQAKLEMRQASEDLRRMIHDRKFAKELSRIPEDEWAKSGDNFEKPLGLGCSINADTSNGYVFKLYCKGLVSEELINGVKVSLAGIGIAICDAKDNLIFELKKPLIESGMSRNAVETKALIEGLNAALSLELKRITVFCDYYPLYQFVTRRWPPKQRKIAVLVKQVFLLKGKFMRCKPRIVARDDMKYVFELATAAITSQATVPAEPSRDKTLDETCIICLEDTDVDHMFSIDGCLHRYCFSCMKQHVEEKLHQGMVPTCPHEGCKSELKVDSCRKFLTLKLLETWNERIREASIPATEKVYCPYPRCSTLMSKSEVEEYVRKKYFVGRQLGASKCVKCHRLFCMNCKVPWHGSVTCDKYRRSNPNPPTEDVKLKSLASRNLWRQCMKCNHMIELSEGCYHMTCRCGHEFCYNCGADWKNKKATCSCPLWDEDNIMYDESDTDSYDDDDDDDDDDEDIDDDVFSETDSELLLDL